MSSTSVAQQPLNFGPEWFVRFIGIFNKLYFHFISIGFELYQHLNQQHLFRHRVVVVVGIFLNFQQQNIVIQKMKS
jgi:hypothetical protein